MSKLLTKEDFIANLYPKCRDAIEILKFEGSSKPLITKIKATGEIKIWTRANILLRNTTGTFKGNGRKVHNTLTLEQFQEKVDKKFGKGKLKVSEYKNLVSSIKTHCLRCGKEKEYNMASSLLSIQFACQDCDRPHFTKEHYQEEIDAIFGEGEFEILEFSRSNQPVILKHRCGHIMKKRDIPKVRSMLGCPICERAKSKGERDIAKLLLDNNIPFSTEISFPDLRGSKYPLRYDFGIKFDNKLLLIEFDGEQHYLKESRFFSKDGNTDERKNQYAKEHNFPLLRIPYWEKKNIKKLIIDFLRFNDYPFGEYTSSEVETLNTDKISVKI